MSRLHSWIPILYMYSNVFLYLFNLLVDKETPVAGSGSGRPALSYYITTPRTIKSDWMIFFWQLNVTFYSLFRGLYCESQALSRQCDNLCISFLILNCCFDSLFNSCLHNYCFNSIIVCFTVQVYLEHWDTKVFVTFLQRAHVWWCRSSGTC